MHFNCLFLCASMNSSKLDSCHRIKKASHFRERLCASGGNRTRTGVAAHRIFLLLWFSPPSLVCSLDYAFTFSFDLGAPCLVSTRSLSGFARYSHFKGFAEFTEFYIFNFSKCTQILVLQKNCV